MYCQRRGQQVRKLCLKRQWSLVYRKPGICRLIFSFLQGRNRHCISYVRLCDTCLLLGRIPRCQHIRHRILKRLQCCNNLNLYQKRLLLWQALKVNARQSLTQAYTYLSRRLSNSFQDQMISLFPLQKYVRINLHNTHQ